MKKKLYHSVFLLCLFYSCAKESGSLGVKDIYFYDAADKRILKNGVAMDKFSNAPNGYGVFAITALGSDFYVAGYIFSDTSQAAAYWKNGNLTRLTNARSAASSITVLGSDVYITGTSVSSNGLPCAVYWKNGKMTELTSTTYSYATSIAVSGSDTYVAGGVLGNHSESVVYWKNGQMTTLGISNSGPSNIAVTGTDVYVINGSSLWKNNELTPVAIGISQTATFLALTTSGADVYIAGYSNTSGVLKASLWKNGVQYQLTDEPSVANSIVLIGKDVYVGGYLLTSKIIYWKNGESSISADGVGEGMALTTQ